MSTRDASLSLFPYFEDLVHDEYNEVFLEGSVEDELTLKDEANLDDPSVVLIDSQSLSLQEILDQLQVRGPSSAKPASLSLLKASMRQSHL